MELIDWGGVARSALWIMGLSLVLATCSYASWQSAQRRISLRKMLNRAAYQAAATTGLSLFAAGCAWGGLFNSGNAWLGSPWPSHLPGGPSRAGGLPGPQMILKGGHDETVR